MRRKWQLTEDRWVAPFHVWCFDTPVEPRYNSETARLCCAIARCLPVEEQNKLFYAHIRRRNSGRRDRMGWTRFTPKHYPGHGIMVDLEFIVNTGNGIRIPVHKERWFPTWERGRAAFGYFIRAADEVSDRMLWAIAEEHQGRMT